MEKNILFPEIRKNPLYSAEAELKHREIEEERKQERLRKAEEIKRKRDTVRCPRCGSTQIQMVPRKYSAFTGFFTNKVDRVCVACKHKF